MKLEKGVDTVPGSVFNLDHSATATPVAYPICR